MKCNLIVAGMVEAVWDVANHEVLCCYRPTYTDATGGHVFDGKHKYCNSAMHIIDKIYPYIATIVKKMELLSRNL